MAEPKAPTPEATELDIAYTYHPPGNNGPRFEAVRDAGKLLAETILEQAPDSPERDEALVQVRTAVMWANASIACETARKALKPRRNAA